MQLQIPTTPQTEKKNLSPYLQSQWTWIQLTLLWKQIPQLMVPHPTQQNLKTMSSHSSASTEKTRQITKSMKDNR